MIYILIAVELFGIAILISLLVSTYRSIINGEIEPYDPCIRHIYIPKIKNGSKLTIGKDCFTTVVKVDQHFNWLQKKMWRFLLGIKVENYSED